MVRFKSIVRIIEDDVVKCSERLTLPKPVVKLFNNFHEETCGQKPLDKEKCLNVDTKGNIVYEKLSTQRGSVDVGWEEICKHYDETGNETHIEHNHPPRKKHEVLMAECLSEKDLIAPFMQYKRTGEDGEEEIALPVKSISCESPNGSRMTLVRGDNFNIDNTRAVIKTNLDFVNYWRSYCRKYTRTRNKYIKDAFNSQGDDFDFEKVKLEADKFAIDKHGRFEQTTEFKDFQKQYRDNGCRLEYTYPFEFTPSDNERW